MKYDWNKITQLSDMTSFEETQEFEKMVWDFVAQKENTVLEKLLNFFDDNCEYDEVMFSIIHAIETYDDDIYVKCILNNLYKIFKKSPHWGTVILYRIWNHDNCFNIFKKNIYLSNQEALFQILDLMAKESPDRLQLIDELKEERKKFSSH